MKKIALFLLLSFPLCCFGQTKSMKAFQEADSLIINNNMQLGFQKLELLEQEITPDDPIYDEVIISLVRILSHYEYNMRMSQQYDLAINYAKEALSYMRKSKYKYSEEFNEREAYMMKNLVINYNGLQQYDSAKVYVDWLYNAKIKNRLPKGLIDTYNFDFFRIDSLNVWGYEWYDQLPNDRLSTSFSKIVYYIYNTDAVGNDREQLYRFHVLMYHGNNEDYDYILDKRIDADTTQVGGTYYGYNYKASIDYAKLHKDIIEIITTNRRPDVKHDDVEP